MFNLLKQRSPVAAFLLIIIGLVLKLPLFLHPHQLVITEKDAELYHFFFSFLTGDDPQSALFSSVIAFTLLLLQAFMINYLVNHFRMISRATFFPALAYLLITSLLPEWNYLTSPLVANTLVIWAFMGLFKTYNVTRPRLHIFNIGLAIGLASYFFFPSAAFIVCLLAGLLILIPFRLNEMIILFMGGLTPAYFYGSYLFLTGELSIKSFFPRVSVFVPTINNSINLGISIFLLAIPFLIGGFLIQANMSKMLIQVRKNWSILLIYILFGFFIPFINNSGLYENWILITAPFAAFHACSYYYTSRKWIPYTILILSSGFIFYQQYLVGSWR